jgi:hypothetical protein
MGLIPIHWASSVSVFITLQEPECTIPQMIMARSYSVHVVGALNKLTGVINESSVTVTVTVCTSRR